MDAKRAVLVRENLYSQRDVSDFATKSDTSFNITKSFKLNKKFESVLEGIFEFYDIPSGFSFSAKMRRFLLYVEYDQSHKT